MAYVNLINQVVADKTEAFCRLRDFIAKRNGTYDYSTTGIGWTLIDSSYSVDEDNPQSGDWVVFSSVGEDSTEDLYFRFKWGTTDFDFNGFLYWNPTTHIGLVAYASAVNKIEFNNTDINVPTYIYGDLDSIFVIFIPSTIPYSGFIGRLESPFSSRDDTKGNCTSGALIAGSDKSITLDSIPSEWVVGGSLYIWSSDSTTTNIEKVEIKTIVSNTITVDLTKAYSSGAKLSQHCGYSGNDTTGNNLMQSYKSIINAYGVSGTLNYSHYPAIKAADDIIEWVKPDPLNSEWGLAPFVIGQTSRGFVGVVKNVLFCNSTGLSNVDVLVLPDGTEYRVFIPATSSGFCFREV
jgi:hypothetical protein